MAIEGITSAWQKNETKYHAVTGQECEKLIEASFRIMEEIKEQANAYPL